MYINVNKEVMDNLVALKKQYDVLVTKFSELNTPAIKDKEELNRLKDDIIDVIDNIQLAQEGFEEGDFVLYADRETHKVYFVMITKFKLGFPKQAYIHFLNMEDRKEWVDIDFGLYHLWETEEAFKDCKKTTERVIK